MTRGRENNDRLAIHPYERTPTARRRQPDGTHAEAVHGAGRIQAVALPEVAIDLDTGADPWRQLSLADQ